MRNAEKVDKRQKEEWSARDARHRRQSRDGSDERARAASEFQLRSRTETGLFRFTPDDVLVVTAIDQRVHFAIGIAPKEDSAFDTFAEEYF